MYTYIYIYIYIYICVCVYNLYGYSFGVMVIHFLRLGRFESFQLR